MLTFCFLHVQHPHPFFLISINKPRGALELYWSYGINSLRTLSLAFFLVHSISVSVSRTFSLFSIGSKRQKSYTRRIHSRFAKSNSGFDRFGIANLKEQHHHTNSPSWTWRFFQKVFDTTSHINHTMTLFLSVCICMCMHACVHMDAFTQSVWICRLGQDRVNVPSQFCN